MKTWKTAFLCMTAGAFAQTAGDSPVPSNDEIRRILVERIDTERKSVGIVVGVIEPDGRRIVSYGALDKGDARPLNGDTVFEIGSISKVFTSLLLSDMVLRDEVALSDPVAKYLPKDVKVPQRNGREITLEDLSTHTSGLPRLPNNMKPKDAANPYADYGPAQLYQFLGSYELTRDIGAKWEYSNLGGGLLGHALALRGGEDYEELVRALITQALGMHDTGITLTPEMKSRMAVGHNADLRGVKNWDFDALAGAGALRSTANDLLKFLAANLGYEKTNLARSMAAMLKVRRPGPGPGVENALGWLVNTQHGREIVWHDGGTYGFGTFIGFDAKARVGVVVLSNTFTIANGVASVDDIGMHLLDPQSPLATGHKEVSTDRKLWDGYLGRYQLKPDFILAITREDEHLFVQATNQPKFEIFPEGDKDFFLKALNAQITFKTGGDGRATELTLHQGGMDQKAGRIE